MSLVPQSLFLHSSNNDLWVYAAFGIAAGIYLFYRGFRNLQRKRLLLNTPSSKLRSASIGLVEVSGLATGPYTIPAPVTAVPCYFYRTIAWQLKKSGKNEEWHKVAEESLHVPFFLDDNTAKVLVDPQDAELDIHRDFHEEYRGSVFGTMGLLPENVAAFLSRHGVSNTSSLRVDEYCIKPKNALFILGTLAPNPGLEVRSTPINSIASKKFSVGVDNPLNSGISAHATFSVNTTVTFHKSNGSNGSSQPEVIRLGSDGTPASSAEMTQQGKIAAALMKAGITNPAAWAAAGVDSATAGTSHGSVVTESGSGDFDLHPPTVLMKGTHDSTFLISWRSQQDLVQSLNWRSVAMIWGGPAIALLCLYYVLLHFDLL